ncbi:SusC/RagA family TonB-linked outer membrane protein [Puteibacter caeruleilacunae]|nr:SusC/RagA family TonB-linked outer membrane protein [Puteibacter caeruleilacunae]
MEKKFNCKGIGMSIPIRKLLMIMKLTSILILVLMMQVSASTFGQEQRINLTFKDYSLKEVFRLIEENSEFSILYKEQLLENKKLITGKYREAKVADILNELLKEQKLTYKINDKMIVILAETSKLNQDKTITLTGTVVDESGEPLPGVSVFVKGTTIGITTDFDGKYSLKVPSSAKTIMFTFVGMKAEEIDFNGQSKIDVTLKPDAIGLEEVVAVGYGVQKKANLTGSVASVSSERLEDRPITTTAQGLQGVIPNLNITFTSGEPGNQGAQYNIRGGTSINGGSPLILVDGIEQDLELINPNDIESVTVLKDAASAAIYGARAAFGVILVTTKKAKRDTPTRVTYSGQMSWNKPIKMPELVDNSYEYALAVNEAMRNYDENTYVFSDESIAKIKAYYDDPVNNPEWEIDENDQFRFYGHTDWKKELIKDFAPTQQHNINVAGGGKKSSYYTSLGYLKQEGLYRHGTDSYERYNVRVNVNNDIKDWLEVNFRMSYNSKKTDKPHVYKSDANYINSIVFSRPTSALRYPGDREGFEGLYFENAVSYQKFAGRDIYKNHDLWLTTEAIFKVTEDLRINTDFTYQNYSANTEKNATQIDFMTPKFEMEFGQTGDDYIQLTNTHRNHYAFNIYGEYEKRFNEKHYFKGMIGFNQEWRKQKSFSALRKELISQEIPAINLALGDQMVDGSEGDYAIRGAFYRLNYIYKDKYLFEFNGRYDGTSRFQKSDRFGFFPSVSAGWRLSEEQFFKDALPLVNNLKFRATYGALGNQKTSSYYEYIAEMESRQTTRYLFNNLPALAIKPPKLIPESLTWESISTVNVGIDLNMFDNRFGLIFDRYRRSTSDMLMQKEYPELLGASAPYENAAELETNGWELQVSWNDKIGSDFKYGIELSLSDYQTEITKYDNPSGALDDWYEGRKFGDIWGYETEGIFQSMDEIEAHADQSSIAVTNWAPGDIKYKDQPGTDGQGDGKIDRGSLTLDDHGDLKLIGNSTPRYSYGINLNASYKNFFATVFFQGVGKREFFPEDQLFWPFATQYFQLQTHFIPNSWSEDNRDAYFGRLLARDGRNRQVQSRFIQDASYIRLKNLTLGYNLPKSFVQKTGFVSGKIFVSGQNLWTHSNIGRPYDPEGFDIKEKHETSSKTEGLLYPMQKTYSVGVTLSF